ncbi:hypothetical protein [Roseibium sp. RKSG952]|uniref:hypothetical protein n=1 Tax=Roseibium sp. RKSG952 TaxID=2529384 RepID=UPI0012BBE632|nr:hypothetical protein [Roseibium sp. RKSG952]MTI03030.1 hypothetical protein [Roseibium sp. RKSG952]
MTDYVMAIRRERRGSEPADLTQQITNVPGVVNVTPGPSGRIVISASPAGIAEVKNRFGELCRIEPIILHDLSKKGR